jgi:hypothetical protein
VIKERVNGIALAPAEDFRRDSDLFLDRARTPESQARTKSAMNRGFQTRNAEMDLDRMLGELGRTVIKGKGKMPKLSWKLLTKKTAELRDAALRQHRGGVGCYGSSDFVHVDVGRVRRW